ncbi:MbtH protein [Luteibacter rhizovicinus]|uniref:MbtH protein n=1 Tax=Luteibacter rhizovicinus TaxID=242606 RepID=A0A4R3YR37_9GAMM|nr:MbtH family NRPS accessory protein [Luteibacter rhizovicinus]TCV93443.1 MbtH protein [Luteibacter rhizovicinus]
MSTSSSSSEAMYEVVVNQEGQYSIWPVIKALPQGWTKAGKQGSKEFCLEFVSEVWTDMRPLSLRARMESMQSS